MVPGELSAGALSNCRTSGFVASAAPSEDYAFDTNIDTTLGLSIDALLQDYVVRPAWMALVWLVHALLVALEWSYTLELLRGPLASGLTLALGAAQAQFTGPWLVSALAFAGVLAAYHGIVRRRVAQTLGEAAAMIAMIVAAMFVIADPSGTVGVLSRWADEASIGSFAAIGSGSDVRPYHALAASMEGLYSATIEAPWCFLEFGDVSWCDQPTQLDPRLEKTAVRIASRIEAEAGRSGHRSGVSAEVLSHRAQLLRSAHTNGQIFLAFPANGPVRNSVKESSSLFYVLCGGGSDATRCRGPTAARAEFRANSGTLPRLAGLLVIALGVFGMLLLLGFVVVRLLEAAILSILFLLLAPAAALAPTLGEPGRAAFRSWAARLLGAVTAKLLWSIVLGGLLGSLRIILSLQGLGWLVQWLLSGALWWGVLRRRHELLARGSGGRAMEGARQSRFARSAEDATIARGREAGQVAWRRVVPWRKRRERRPDEQEGPTASGPGALEQMLSATAAPRGFVDAESRSGGSRAAPSTPASRRATGGALQERLSRLQAAHATALADGDVRRAVSLRLRRQRVQEQIADRNAQGSRSETQKADRAPRRGRSSSTRTARAARRSGSTPVDGATRPAARSGASHRSGASPGQAARPVGWKAGTQDARQAPRASQQAPRASSERPGSRAGRAGLDHDISERREAARASSLDRAGSRAADAQGEPGRRPAHADEQPQSSHAESRRGNTRRRPPRIASATEDPVMRDAIEVAEHRQRQLGWSWRSED
jgi:hypothetical protein